MCNFDVEAMNCKIGKRRWMVGFPRMDWEKYLADCRMLMTKRKVQEEVAASIF
jgi:hypothetical protein